MHRSDIAHIFPLWLAAVVIVLIGSVLQAAPVVSNLTAAQRVGTKLVDITYDLAAPGFGAVSVTIKASSDGGATWTVPVTSVTGAVGVGVTPGTGKTIVWDAGADWPRSYSTQMGFRITADDGVAVFAHVPGGSFTMGVTSGDTDSNAPSITVTVSPFYIQQTETTKAQWDEVRTWAVNNGYTDLAAGAGKAANHPVQKVSWWDVVKWCNALSEKEGLTPVYSVSGAVMRTGTTEPTPNWNANGYRLPTEAEWEKAARGGVSGKRFPWGTDTISHAQANYLVYSSNGTTNFYSYDVEPRPPATGSYYHPSYKNGVSPYTSPVGSFGANGYGLYDMSGNVWEWCWDWYGEGYYTTSNGTTDPRGPASGTDRVSRGGSWDYYGAFNARCAFRTGDKPGREFDASLGFRPARSSVSGGGVVWPTVTSPTATSITATGATLGGNVTADGGAAITERGVVYSATDTNSDPIISGTGVTKVTATGTTGVFTAPAITGLTQGTGYSYKAYAINSQGRTTYTSVGTFTTSTGGGGTPAGFSLIPGGSFAMGVTSGDTDSNAPSITVTVSPFYIQQTETTKARWDEVRTWAVNNGYTDLAAGAGKAANHPVQKVNWWDVVKWCNARSEKEGLTPVYSVSGAVMRTGTTAPTPNWSANGYRLPTEAEWEKAARGGVSGKRFPWGTDTISHAQANYRVYSSNRTTNFYSYDVEPRPGTGTDYYHPSYTAGGTPCTSPVGSFGANGYGLYDMSGNVSEWCWDWHGYSYYTTSNGTTDPRGPASGTDRVIRGGSWDDDASGARCAPRFIGPPGYTFLGNGICGLRLARSSVP